MITRVQLAAYARTTGLKPHQQEKNYVQTIILRSLYTELNERLVFKGGTALMFAYGLRRFSDDLDFTGPRGLGLRTLVQGAAQDLSNLGMTTSWKERAERTTGTTFTISCQGPLYSTPPSAVSVRIEVSGREGVVEEPRSTYLDSIYPDVSPFAYLVMTPSEIMAEKVRAILTRNQARDLFDLAFLVGKENRTTVELVNQKLSHYHKSFDRSVFLDKVESYRDLWMPEMRSIVLGRVPDFDEVARAVNAQAHQW